MVPSKILESNKNCTMKKIIKWFMNSWKSETPKLWKSARNAAAFITIAVPTLAGISTTVPNITVPSWFTEYAWYLMAVSGLLTLYAGTRTKKATSDEGTV